MLNIEETNMGKHEIIDMALQLKAAERYEVAEKIVQSLESPIPKSIKFGRKRRCTGRGRAMKGG